MPVICIPEGEELQDLEASDSHEKAEAAFAHIMGELLPGEIPVAVQDNRMRGAHYEKSPIESWYERPKSNRPLGVMISSGARDIICISGGYSAFQKISFRAQDLKLLAREILKMAKPFDWSERLKARELSVNLDRAALDAEDKIVILVVAPLDIWQNNSST
ncbi:MAG TPA: hypothetical protein VKZ53_04205 [Candidatus Angelobacter sp.]|nr:hypothetical protein [Candidatus Angelobacter sp.]